MMRFVVWTALFGIALPAGAATIPVERRPVPVETRLKLEEGFSGISAAVDASAAAALIQSIRDADLSTNQWGDVFAKFFKDRAFTPALAQFWSYASRRGSEVDNEMLALSGTCAVQALAAEIARWAPAPDDGSLPVPPAPRDRNPPAAKPDIAPTTPSVPVTPPVAGKPPAVPKPESPEDKKAATLIPSVGDGNILNSLAWLAQIAPNLSAEARTGVMNEWLAALEQKTLDLTTALQPGAQPDAALARLAMQFCLTLAAYSDKKSSSGPSVTQLLKLPERCRDFYLARRRFLFDNQALAPPQLALLDSVLQALPDTLYSADAFLMPEAYRINPTDFGLAAANWILPIPPIAANEVTPPNLWATRPTGPVASRFTITFAAGVMRAVQSAQFTQRPWLTARRDALIARHGARPASYLRTDIAPDYYVQYPDELIPLTAALWFADSAFTFRVALDLLALREPGAMEAVLLLADVLSNGQGATGVFAAGPNGELLANPAPVERAPLFAPPRMVDNQSGSSSTEPAAPTIIGPVTGIAILGRIYQFAVDESGAVTGMMGGGGGLSF